jgi:hypothetical protein
MRRFLEAKTNKFHNKATEATKGILCSPSLAFEGLVVNHFVFSLAL